MKQGVGGFILEAILRLHESPSFDFVEASPFFKGGGSSCKASYKPDSVLDFSSDDHSSGISVAANLKQLTRITRVSRRPVKDRYSYLVLLQIRFFQMHVTMQARELLPRVFTLALRRYILCDTFSQMPYRFRRRRPAVSWYHPDVESGLSSSFQMFAH